MPIKDYAKSTQRSSRRRKKPKSTQGKNRSLVVNFNPMLVLVVVVGGLFAGSVFYIEYFRDLVAKFQGQQSSDTKVIQAKKSDKSEKLPLIAKAPSAPKFEFYRTLPKMQVSIDKDVERVASKPGKPVGIPLENVMAVNEKKPVDAINTPTAVSAAPAEPVVAGKPETVKQINPAQLKLAQNKNGSAYVLQLASFRELKDAEQLKAKLILAGFNVTIHSIKLANGDTWHRVKTSQLSDLALANDINDKLKEHNIKGILLTEKLSG